MGTTLNADDIRIAALARLDALNTAREKEFDDIVRLACHICEAPIGLVSLVERDRQWFKVCVGLDVEQTSRDVSFCSHAIAQNDVNQVFVVPDATLDPRFQENPLVLGSPHIRMYAGAPLVTQEGVALGSLCVIDTHPRSPTSGQLEALTVLSRSVVAQMELRQVAEALRQSEERYRLVIDAAMDAVMTVDSDGHVTAWNQKAEAVFGWSAAEAIGRQVADLISPSGILHHDSVSIAELFTVASDAGLDRCIEMSALRRDGSMFPAEISTTQTKTRMGSMVSAFVRDISDRKRQEEQTRESDTRDVAIFAMARLAESRDPETGAHLERVRSYCWLLARQLKKLERYTYEIDDEYIRLIYSTSPLHDIGKVGIPDGVLLKPGRLSDHEFGIMKSHAEIGAETLDAALRRFPRTKFLRMARDIAATHHERFDGTGYPKGLKGRQIPLCGRIVAVADVFDALSSKRVYKEAFANHIVKSIILEESGSHFDPVIVEAFEACYDEMLKIHEEFREAEQVAV